MSHRHDWWDTGAWNDGKRDGRTNGETLCITCGAAPGQVRCATCGELESETTISHGTWGNPLHSVRRSNR